MDWDYAIERNREALKRVLAALAAMAALPVLLAGGARPTLPRHLHRAVLRLLRPAESAARRLVIMASRGLVVALPRSHPRKPKQPTLRPGTVTGIWMPPHLRPQADRPARPARACALPLFDALPRWGARKRKAASGVPRLCLPGLSALLPVPPGRQSKGRLPLAPDDAIDAGRLALRLHALASALDDLPAQARRFARWRTRRDAERQKQASGPARARRLSPLRPGRPPGALRRPGHELHEILNDAHSLAVRALDGPDTS